MKNIDFTLTVLSFVNLLSLLFVDNDVIKAALYVSLSIFISANIIVSAINKRG